jgi:hypothetical protein
LRRLIDLPGIADLEYKALLKPRMADLGSRPDYPEIDEACVAAFGISAEAAEAVARPEGWDGIEDKLVAKQVAQAETEGWDLTAKGKPLRMLEHLAGPFWLAARGVAGSLPFEADTSEEDAQEAQLKRMAKEAAAFRKNKV